MSDIPDRNVILTYFEGFLDCLWGNLASNKGFKDNNIKDTCIVTCFITDHPIWISVTLLTCANT